MTMLPASVANVISAAAGKRQAPGNQVACTTAYTSTTAGTTHLAQRSTRVR
jgi:hypothetical protein